MTRDEQTRWSLRLAEAGGAMVGAVIAVLVTVIGSLAGLPVIRAAIYGIVLVVACGVCVLLAWNRAGRPR
jgi:uncharacterized membrane protein YccC